MADTEVINGHTFRVVTEYGPAEVTFLQSYDGRAGGGRAAYTDEAQVEFIRDGRTWTINGIAIEGYINCRWSLGNPEDGRSAQWTHASGGTLRRLGGFGQPEVTDKARGKAYAAAFLAIDGLDRAYPTARLSAVQERLQREAQREADIIAEANAAITKASNALLNRQAEAHRVAKLIAEAPDGVNVTTCPMCGKPHRAGSTNLRQQPITCDDCKEADELKRAEQTRRINLQWFHEAHRKGTAHECGEFCPITEAK